MLHGTSHVGKENGSKERLCIWLWAYRLGDSHGSSLSNKKYGSGSHEEVWTRDRDWVTLAQRW